LAKGAHRADIVRGEMRPTLRTMAEGSTDIAAAADAGAVGSATPSIIRDDWLYALEGLQDLDRIARDPVDRETPFGDAAARIAAVRVALTVADTGVGAPQVAPARVFESVEQADRTTTRRWRADRDQPDPAQRQPPRNTGDGTDLHVSARAVRHDRHGTCAAA
jgi:signal transduction histidine kinase